MKFKDNLRKVRKTSNFSQEKLAEEMSVSRQTISKWENGGSYPSTKHILELTKVLQCTYDELINGKSPLNSIKNRLFMSKKVILTGLIIILGAVFSIGAFRLVLTGQYSDIDKAKLAAFDSLAEDFLTNSELFPSDNTIAKIVGYGISDEDGTFYIKCDVYSSTLPGNHCSAIIYFCEDNGDYSYKCQILDNPDYRPSGEYYQVI